MKRIAKISIPTALIAAVCQPAIAQGFEYQGSDVRLRASIDTLARVTDQSSDVAQLEQFSVPTVSIVGTFRWRNENRDQFTLQPGIVIQSFAGEDELDNLTASVFGTYRRNLESIERGQLRLRFGVERNNRFPDERFVRYTAQGALNIRQDGGRSATYTLRYRYRDQNEGNSFDGFDQNEYLASVRYAWSYRDQPLELFAVTPFIDIRDAEADNFDSTQIGVRVQARYRLDDDLTVTLRARASARDFDGVFSPAFPVAREDRRFAVEAELRKEIGENSTLFGAIGYEDNNSNIAVRDFSGATFRIGYEVKF